MSFFAVLFALLLEQLKSLPRDTRVHDAAVTWCRWTARNFDAGKPQHARVVWWLSVAAPTVLVWLVHLLVAHFSLLLALVLNVGVLYLTLGFRSFSHYITDIRQCLERNDEAMARQLLSDWLHLDASELPQTEVLRHVIEHGLLAAHRHVFGVFFFFVLMAAIGFGAAGAVFYRMSEFMSRYWAYQSNSLQAPTNEELRRVSTEYFGAVDFVPARLTAFGFAVVGNFEEAINGWRRDATLWHHVNEGVILASAAGAVGVQLGGHAAPGITPDRSKTFSTGVAADAMHSTGSTLGVPVQLAHLRNVVALVWRSVVLWMLLLALMTLANLVG
jgi:adenosylcobinamide-phosphate synthase